MTACYLDTSYLVALAFGEREADDLATRLQTFDLLLSSTLLEAEFRSTLAREGVPDGERFLQAVSWILPDRRLTPEIDRILATGYVRGADLKHLACALYAAESPSDLTFLTLDDRQREIAAELSFPT
jgi:predicted nucleic acid-binding protein